MLKILFCNDISVNKTHGFCSIHFSSSSIHCLFVFSECKCPQVVRVSGKVPSGLNKAFVSWNVPKPNCRVSLSSVTPPEARDGKGSFSIGEHDVFYNYVHNSPTGSFSLQCPVKVTIEGNISHGHVIDLSPYIYCTQDV